MIIKVCSKQFFSLFVGNRPHLPMPVIPKHSWTKDPKNSRFFNMRNNEAGNEESARP